MTTHSGIAVFAGPSIPAPQVLARLPGAALRPPVQLGDVLQALKQGFHTLVLIDGVFEQVPAVWHKEILLALSQGVRVIGASSMGALRAAELDGFGLEGVGWVYEQYRDGLSDDDEVALLHADAEMGYANLSVPMIQLRYVQRCVASTAAEREVLGALSERLKPVFYRERTLACVAEHLQAVCPAGAACERLLALLQDPAHQIKRLDALLALQRAAQLPSARPARPTVEHTVFLQQLQRSLAEPAERLQPRELLAKALAALPLPDNSAGARGARQAQAQRLLRDWQQRKQLLGGAAVRQYLHKRQLDEAALFAFVNTCAGLDAGPGAPDPAGQRRAQAFLELI